MRPWWHVAAISAIAALVLGTPALGQPDEPQRMEVEAFVFRPAVREPTPERIRQLSVPDGFEVGVFARDLDNIRMFAVGDDGTLYATRRTQGDVLMLRDTDSDGQADVIRSAARQNQAHGITLRDGKAYIATIREVYAADIQDDGTFGPMRCIIDDLPDGGQHPNRTLAFGPDDKLYVSIGSSCNACDEPNQEHATMLQISPDGSRRVFARGLRNTIGFAWHPQTEELWGMDHGSDWLGNDEPPEELNRLVDGAHYGWPWVYGMGKVNHSVPWPTDREMSRDEFAEKSTKPVLTYVAHSSPLGLVFYTARQFPAVYRNSAFITMRGSWNRKPPSGYEVIVARFENGSPTRFEPFMGGFLIEDGQACFGRPVGIAVARDGSLLVGDDTNGMIYRISHRAGLAGR